MVDLEFLFVGDPPTKIEATIIFLFHLSAILLLEDVYRLLTGGLQKGDKGRLWSLQF